MPGDHGSQPYRRATAHPCGCRFCALPGDQPSVYCQPRNDNLLDAVVVLHLTLDIALADNSGNFSNAGQLTTKAFTVPHQGIRTITNLNLGTGGDVKTETFEFDDAAKSKLQDGALATGQFPAGTYTIHLGLTNLGCTQEVVM